jgi:hypothetical protein
MIVVASSKKNKKNQPPLLSMTLTNRFEGSCGTLERKRKTHCCQRLWVNLFENNNNNNNKTMTMG